MDQFIAMGNKLTSRRQLIGMAGYACAIGFAGCLGDDDSNTPPTDSPTASPTVTATETPKNTPTEEPTESPTAEPSVFSNYRIDGVELIAILSENSVGEVSELRLETPSNEKHLDVGSTITEYTFEIHYERAGTWYLDALDDTGDIVETVEFSTTFDVSVDQIGTLSQLGIAGESPAAEELNIQLTVSNLGDVPIEPRYIDIRVPEFDARASTIGQGGMLDGSLGGLVDRDGELVIPSGGDNTYRYESGNARSNLLIFDEEEARNIAGQSFAGEFAIEYIGDRENTLVPITVNLGETVVTDTEAHTHAHLRGTTVHKR